MKIGFSVMWILWILWILRILWLVECGRLPGEHLKLAECPCAWKADCAATSLGVQSRGFGSRERPSRRKQSLLVDANFQNLILQVDLLNARVWLYTHTCKSPQDFPSAVLRLETFSLQSAPSTGQVLNQNFVFFFNLFFCSWPKIYPTLHILWTCKGVHWNYLGP